MGVTLRRPLDTLTRGRLWNRRDAVTTLGAAAAALWAGRGTLPAQTSIIRTLTSDIDPRSLSGAVLFHEHLSMRFPLGAAEHFTDDVALMIEEARAARADGVACLVDGGHSDMGRNLDALRRITSESGLPVVASGGLYLQARTPRRWRRNRWTNSPTSSCARRASSGSGLSARSASRAAR